ncbi:protein kinase domain protein [Ichthyophthirius multifiliis]|uniref:Protein kinase domain protein n=1 Tax=Ichthyophthirius multifiliis TaxID=5932 RepID=G0QZR2_ICHMU|nr:protein kinase domain protein [Ichthyophthirius multifiliis]EGR29301.1 protein kinase domain protein [Ichthyophthirius multifiliis]|eukprot:XP_004030537.1 protein kinase domain protein [Ichthyophthirius multifiliis]
MGNFQNQYIIDQPLYEKDKFIISKKSQDPHFVSALEYLDSQNVTHGDIRPFNIFIKRSTGQVKLGEQFKYSEPLTAYTQILTKSTNEFYASPQLLENVQRLEAEPDYDRLQNDIFSIGMCLLEVCTLQNVSDLCYNQNELLVKEGAIRGLLEIVRINIEKFK